ncbi:MAG: hypothetical protein V4526_02240 [Patescibacteria group bacterium]
MDNDRKREQQIKYGDERRNGESVEQQLNRESLTDTAASLWELSKQGEPQKEKTVYRLGILAILALLASAGVADLATLIPLVGTFVGPIYWFIIGLYLWKKGFGLLNWRRIVPGLTSTTAELIPAIQALPTITVGIAIIIIFSRFEDKTGIKVIPQVKLIPTRPPVIKNRPSPLNQNQVRQPGTPPPLPSNKPPVIAPPVISPPVIPPPVIRAK